MRHGIGGHLGLEGNAGFGDVWRIGRCYCMVGLGGICRIGDCRTCGDLDYVGNCLCSSDTECRRENDTGIIFPYLNANESKREIVNYSQSCNIHYPVR